MNTLTDEEVVERARHDKDAFALLVPRYEERLDRYLRRLGVKSLEDRQDLLQNVFVSAYRNLNDFDTDLKFSSWIYRIAHNEAVSFFRSNRAYAGHVSIDSNPELLEILKDDADTSLMTEKRLNAEQVARALSELKPTYRDVLVLRFFEEREYSDISDILRIPMGSVATLIHRAKAALRKQLHHLS
jgi:RNA polymerase sigma-70 factor, ECF subfamily